MSANSGEWVKGWVELAEVTFACAEDADLFCAHSWDNGGKAKRIVDYPDGRRIVMFQAMLDTSSKLPSAPTSGVGALTFRAICDHYNATACHIISIAGGVDDSVKAQPMADTMETIIEALWPCLESLPGVVHDIETAKAKVALRLHINKAMADKYLAAQLCVDDSNFWAKVGHMAGSAAGHVADSMLMHWEEDDPDLDGTGY